MRITHPFHPRCGEDFELADRQQQWGQDRLSLKLDDAHAVRIPVSWTSLAAPDPWIVLGAGRARLRVGDLLGLADLLDAIERQRSAR